MNNKLFYIIWICNVVISVLIALTILFFTYKSFWPTGLMWAVFTVLPVIVSVKSAEKFWIKMALGLLGYFVSTWIFIGPFFSRGSLELEAIGYILTLLILLVLLATLISIEHFKLRKTLNVLTAVMVILGIYFTSSLVTYFDRVQKGIETQKILYDIRNGRYSVEEAIIICENLNGSTVYTIRNYCFADLLRSQTTMSNPMRQDICSRFTDDDAGDDVFMRRTKEDWVKLHQCN